MSRIRPASGFEAGMIVEGVCRSATLRSMVASLEASDVIVYVRMRRLPERSMVGGLEFLGTTATDRILRVTITFPLDRASRTAILGHELQHAIEVAANPEIRNRKTFDEFYRSR